MNIFNHTYTYVYIYIHVCVCVSNDALGHFDKHDSR